MESALVAINIVVVVSMTVAAVSMLKAHQANKQVNILARQLRNRLEAVSILLKVQEELKKGKTFSAMDAVGMTSNVVDDMTLEQASKVFADRIEALLNVATGQIKAA
jgi:hypothetical protein